MSTRDVEEARQLVLDRLGRGQDVVMALEGFEAVVRVDQQDADAALVARDVDRYTAAGHRGTANLLRKIARAIRGTG